MANIQASLLKNIAKCGQPLKSKGTVLISPDTNENTLPMDLLMVVDVSGSMAGGGINVVTDSVIHVLNDLLRPEDRISVITFNASARVHTSWTDVNGTVSPFSAGGGTNFGAAVNEILSFLGSNDAGGNRAGMVLFLSDGHSQKPNDDNVRSIPDFGFTMHTIGVTDGANPTQLEHMAELARGHYFHAPSFSDVKNAFSSIFNLGKTVVYAAPDLSISVPEGVTVSNFIQSPQGIQLSDERFEKGEHQLSLGHLHKETRIEIAFDVEVENIECGIENNIVTFGFKNTSSQITVKGSDSESEIMGAPINQIVTLVAQTARAATATKKGDIAAATRAITKLEALSKTVPVASTRATTLIEATNATEIGDRLEVLGRIQATDSGETKLRED